jgi:hypothetical protein
MQEACHWPVLAGDLAHVRDITGLIAFEAITKFFFGKTLISI